MNITEMLEIATEREASDIHITAGSAPVIRVNGELVRIGEEILTNVDTEILVQQLMIYCKNSDKFIESGEMDFAFSLPRMGRFRANVYLQRGSMAAAIRLVPTELPNIADLNIPETILNLSEKTRGLILVTGPTGAGKSTTLAAIIELINQNKNKHILTLEDPIEYLYKHKNSIVNQREIGLDSASFAKALKSAMREDPDVIMVGEMRDVETISTALTAAETGHLVLASLHTMGAAKTVDRIIDIFPPQQQQQVRVQLSSVLQAVITQQLLPTEHTGMIPAFEIMMVSHAIANLIREGKTHQIDTAIQTGTRYGMQTMDGSLVTLYKSGLIARDTLLSACFDPELIEKMIL